MSDQRLILLGEAQRELVDDLRERGFSVLQERFDRAAFGNYLIDLTTSEFTVRVVRERGRWGIEASVPSSEVWAARANMLVPVAATLRKSRRRALVFMVLVPV